MNLFGERLRMLRKEKDMTLDELGDRLEIPKGSLSRYENNLSDPTIEVVKKISAFFNVSLDWISGNTDIREVNKVVLDEGFKKLFIEAQKNGVSSDSLLKFMELLKER